MHRVLASIVFAMTMQPTTLQVPAFQRWLDPANFDEQGRQRVSLSALTATILVNRG
jgi:hypothetical protein